MKGPLERLRRSLCGPSGIGNRARSIGTFCGKARCGVFEEAQMTKPKAAHAQDAKIPAQAALNPGDEAPPGTEGTGDDVCPDCHGKGRIDGAPCATCGGNGTITRAVGGA
jgi:hypothetical protein